MKILVLGSFMMDLVVCTSRAPENGETIMGVSFSRFPGGKGANQAVAAARLGGNVTMAGMLGSDPFGDEMLSIVAKENIDTQYILRDPQFPTGVGSITLDENGNNRIIVVPGANLQYQESDLEKIVDVIKEADLLVVQLEMDLQMTEKAVEIAYQANVPVILNPAPARELKDELLAKVTYLTPNETEAEILTGIKVSDIWDAERAANVLQSKGIKHVVITLAEKGALVATTKGTTSYIPGFSVKPVDTVAAGDAFNGALAVALVGGKPLVEAVSFANAVGALAVTKAGAIPSLPTLKEVVFFIESQVEAV
jgi:ribokinase